MPCDTVGHEPLALMQDIHAQLHLRPLTLGSFHLLLWRHILSKEISNLYGLRHIVKPDMITVPKDLLRAIATFLNGGGDIIWPRHAASRNHLSDSSRLLQQGYRGSDDSTGVKSGPIWLEDGFMTPDQRRKWRDDGDGTEPPPHTNVINFSARPSAEDLRVFDAAA